ncbi:unnamed protein product [Protopolystoma xenopodis]|uniref:Uncharacterized protein n=1 Tax=Protopolystoma xenopodis TaxID=117903 RepID=A0A3S5FGF7_9PLAT|nr:unnamed protein product [Protopolystoma xenopodis]
MVLASGHFSLQDGQTPLQPAYHHLIPGGISGPSTPGFPVSGPLVNQTPLEFDSSARAMRNRLGQLSIS